jgi:peptidoglycan lytic transglycosylase B
VASYLKAHGWAAGEPAAVRVKLPKGSASGLVSGLQRVHTVPALKEMGVKFPSAMLAEGACSVVELPKPGAAPGYLVGFGNFEAITRYNRSTFYATAVLDLAEAIRSERKTLTAENDEAAAVPAS